MKGVIFDLDGTLVDSAPDIHAAANALLRAMGYQPLAIEVVRSFIGNGIPKLVERVMRVSDIEFEPDRHASLTSQFVNLYAEYPAAKSRLYPGVLDCLKDFKEQGCALGVCTNKDYDLTVKVLKGLGIAGYFGSVIGGDSLPTRKPDPAPFHACAKLLEASEVVYVGDSEVDAETATAAQVPFFLYTLGYRKAPLKDLKYDGAFDHFDALCALVSGAEKAVEPALRPHTNTG